MRKDKNRIYLLIFIAVLLILACMCPAQGQEIAATQQAATAQAKVTPQPTLELIEIDISEDDADTSQEPPIEDPDETVIFSYAGENQSYHTGLRNRTVFYIDYETGRVAANEKASFEEPAGTEMTRRGTDTVKFEGQYDGATKSFTGDFNIHTQGTATGGDGHYDNTVTYNLEGVLSAQFVDGQWVGTVTGTATLTQVWPGGGYADEITNYSVEWTITGNPGS